MSPRELAETALYWGDLYRDGDLDTGEYLLKLRDLLDDYDIVLDESEEDETGNCT